jgi:hypothetical protein
MAATDVTFDGLYYIAGKTVSVFVAGLDCGDFTVAADGTVTVPIESDRDGLFNSTTLAAVAGEREDWGQQATDVELGGIVYRVPVVIGRSYTTRGATLRPDTPEDAKTKQGPASAELRRAHQFGVLLDQALSISFGTDFDATLEAASFAYPDNQTVLPGNVSFSGVYRGTLTDDYGYDSMLHWEITRPVPCTITQISGFLETSEH